MIIDHILLSEVFHISGDAVWAVPRPRHHPHPRSRFLRSDLRLQLNFDWFHSTLPPELDCCDEAFLNEDRLQPENMQRCLNLEIDGQCIAFTRWTIINLLKDVRPCILRSDTFCTGGQSVGHVEKARAHREQMNAVTAFIDGSQIYGSDLATANGLRESGGEGARLRTSSEFDNVEILPQRSQCPFSFSTDHPSALVAGDVRAVEQPGLASIQVILILMIFSDHDLVQCPDSLPERAQPDCGRVKAARRSTRHARS